MLQRLSIPMNSMKKIALISFLAVAATAAFGQTTASDHKDVHVVVSDYASITMSPFTDINITDGGTYATQTDGHYGTSAGYTVVNNIQVTSTSAVSNDTALTALGISAHSSVSGSSGTEVGQVFPASGGAPGTVFAWLTGVSTTNSHSANATSFTVTVTVSG